MLNARLLIRNWLWPLVFGVSNAFFLWLGHAFPGLFEALDAAGVDAIWLATLIAAVLGWIMTKWNPIQGGDVGWVVPRARSEHDVPSLRE